MSDRQEFLLDTMADSITSSDGLWGSFLEYSQSFSSPEDAARALARDFKKRGLVARAAQALIAGGIEAYAVARVLKEAGGDTSQIKQGLRSAGLSDSEAESALRG